MSLTIRNTDETLDGTICTFTGRAIKPLDPNPGEISLTDIAHALSNNCRFTGHVREFYSVAQHSVLCSLIVPKEGALEALLHDASEAYLSDMARPIKMQPEFGTVYKAAEAKLEKAIAKRFNLDHPWSETTKWADNVLLRSEQRDLMPARFRHEGEDYLDMEIDPWTPDEAEQAFHWRYNSLEDPNNAIPPSFMGMTLAVGVSVAGDS